MADPVIVPPTPTVRQGESIDTSPGIEAVQKVFDQVLPEIRGTPRSQEKTPAQQPSQAAQEPQKPAAEPEKKEEKSLDESHKLPSFLDEALQVEPPKGAEHAKDEEWPEELPQFKTPQESSDRYKKWRAAYNGLKDEVTKLRARPMQDEATVARLHSLEDQNKQMGEVLTRMGVETHADFQNNIIAPMASAWNEAAQIVKDSGGDPNDLAKAVSLSGKAQFEALDEIFKEMPESARAETNDALRRYRHFAALRQRALAEAPRTMQALQKQDLERQYDALNKQRKEMEQLFDEVGKQLREEAKLEVLIKTNNPETKWWDDQADQIETRARHLYLENTDMRKMALAARLAPAVDAYRNLWLTERAAHAKTKKLVNERLGGEPNLSESSGGNRNSTPEAQFQEDLKKPFSEVFLREFHRSQARNR